MITQSHSFKNVSRKRNPEKFPNAGYVFYYMSAYLKQKGLLLGCSELW